MGARARGLRELHPLRITLPRIADAARHGLKCRVLGSKALNQEGGCGLKPEKTGRSKSSSVRCEKAIQHAIKIGNLFQISLQDESLLR